jgi:hypothetical protein
MKQYTVIMGVILLLILTACSSGTVVVTPDNADDAVQVDTVDAESVPTPPVPTDRIDDRFIAKPPTEEFKETIKKTETLSCTNGDAVAQWADKRCKEKGFKGLETFSSGSLYLKTCSSTPFNDGNIEVTYGCLK